MRKTIRRIWLGAALLGAIPFCNAATQTIPEHPIDDAALATIASQASVAKALTSLQSDNEWTLSQQIELCEIPSPPFKEAARGVAFKQKLIALGLSGVRVDAVGNVFGEIRGSQPGPTVMLSSHLDTVFPEGTNVKVKRDGAKLTAPGIGDDCRGLAANLAIARQLMTTKVPISGRIIVVATVGEEGPGNLRGVRAIFKSAMRDSINYFISVDGIGWQITNRAVGSNRYRVTYNGPGGHSYQAFGMPNPIHAMGRAIAAISDLQVPTNPKVTFNVGIVSGGQTVNSISPSGTMEIDMRSESPEALASLDMRVQSAIQKALKDEIARWPNSKVPLSVKVDTIGIRPAGNTPDTSRIVRTALGAGKHFGLSTPLDASSTDANIAMSLHIPAVTLDAGGIGHGTHALDESYDDGKDGYKGVQWIMLFVLGLTGLTPITQ
ncbi:MAG: M20/M25/M40 family metallo-hydrolase [Gemmatimonadaceae bacterium]